MLKMKDNVDLKELEKFGFEKSNMGYVLYKEHNDNWKQQIASVNLITKKVWISQENKNDVYELLKDVSENIDENK